MSYSVLGNRKFSEKPGYVADNNNDLIELLKTNPPMGTSCLLLTDGKIYILNSNQQWIPIKLSALDFLN